jgi:hypothetical protein
MASRYSPLQRSQAQIRLLRLHPAEKKETPTAWTPKCTMFVVDLDDEPKPRFNALSYAWGPPEPTGTILLDGQEVCVRQNLLDFLRIAVTDAFLNKEPIWIDQVCIDQFSIQERNHQVGLMSRIYTQADQVFAWLGNSTYDSDQAMEISDCRLDFHLPNRRCWKNLLSRPYWARLWIIQEVALAKSLTILCGDKKCGWTMFRLSFGIYTIDRWLSAAKDSMVGDEHIVSVITCALNLIHLQQNYNHVKPHSIGALINKFGHSQCSDPRDKVFGLCALVPESGRIVF